MTRRSPHPADGIPAAHIDARVEVGKLLCARAEFERRDGNVAAASVTLEEARAIAAEV